MTIERQVQREEMMRRRGQERAAKMLARAHPAETPAGVALMRRALAPLTAAISAFVADGLSGRPGRSRRAVALLAGVDPELAAYVAVRGAIAGGVRHYALSTTALNIGLDIELELMAADFEDTNTPLYRSVIRTAQARGLSPDRQAAALRLANRHFDVSQITWTTNDRLQVGTALMELVIEALGIVEVHYVKLGRNHTRHEVQLSSRILDWYEHYNAVTTLLRPLYLPMLVPPRPWTSPFGSPYVTEMAQPVNLITRPFPGQETAMANSDMSVVYNGLNALQATPWRINRRVLAVMREAWERNMQLGCLPPREPEPIPERPLEVEQAARGSKIRKDWRRKVAMIHRRNAAALSTRFEFQRAIDIAEENVDEPAIFFPHRLDFRGRAYPMSTTLNPQGPDEVRALLQFAEGKPLGASGLRWLGIHGANVFGYDKVSLGDRFAWAKDRLPNVLAVVDDPLGNLWWTEADKPWAFLAWCFEWAAAFRSGRPEEFVSHLPIAVDGSCNGIQHFSAMLRDPVGGAAVNLVPSSKPNDIYQTVADRVVERLRQCVDAGGEEAWMAAGWLSFGISRKITKRPVMVLPYGGTFTSCVEYVREAVQDRIKAGDPSPFGADAYYKATMYLAKLVWDSISDVVVAARQAMTWLQGVARVANKSGVALSWTAPSGFVVVQDYRERRSGRIKTRFCGNIVYFRSQEVGKAIDGPKQISAIAPNFVHSLDAAALMFTIEAGTAAGITSWAMIHDSYGTHAADTDKLGRVLREQFVRMYTEHDVLAEFRDATAARIGEELAADLPELPAAGSLDIRAVMGADYFFA